MRWIAMILLTFAMCESLACDKTIHEARTPAPIAVTP